VVMSWRALVWCLVFIKFVSLRVANVVPGSFFLFSAVVVEISGALGG